MAFSEKLQPLRKQRGWSQDELAARIRISRQAVSKWENGTAVPDTENVLALADLFGVSTDYLLETIAPATGTHRPFNEKRQR